MKTGYKNAMLYNSSIIDAIGETPLVGIPIARPAFVLAKLEYLNPGGSIKDRTALYMVEKAEQQGLLKPGGIIIEASSGNQGIALAMIGAVKGYSVIITVSEKVSEEKRRTLQAYGAQLVVCPATDDHNDPRNYHYRADVLHKQLPGSFMPNQYFNTDNPKAHYMELGPEIWRQTNGTITHYFAAAGTGGQISGVGKYLKERNPAVKVIAVDAASSFHATGGQPRPYVLEGIGVDYESPCLDETVIDEFVNVQDNDALEMLKILASDHGILVGPSSGAVAFAIHAYRDRLREQDVVVTVFSDSGRAYLSKDYFN